MMNRAQRWHGLVAGWALACAALWWAPASAQPVGIERPCPAQPLPSSAFRKQVMAQLIEPHVSISPEALDRFSKTGTAAAAGPPRAAGDWADLCRYRALDESAQASLTPPRVVFIGDSITENWGLADPALFDGKIANRGIGDQTSAQMLVRFRADVVALRPRTVHILAGTGDLTRNAGVLSVQDFQNNIMSMVDLARLNAIAVVLGSIPPASGFGPQHDVNPAATIEALNDWLKAYAAKQRLGFVDYHAALVGPNGALRADLSNDGVHPNRNGYAVMRKLAEQALAALDAH